MQNKKNKIELLVSLRGWNSTYISEKWKSGIRGTHIMYFYWKAIRKYEIICGKDTYSLPTLHHHLHFSTFFLPYVAMSKTATCKPSLQFSSYSSPGSEMWGYGRIFLWKLVKNTFYIFRNVAVKFIICLSLCHSDLISYIVFSENFLANPF